MQNEIKIQQLQFQLLIQRLSIEIRFPCRLTATVKLGKEEVVSIENVSLDSGVARFTEALTVKGLITQIDGKNQDKKGFLTIYVLSNSGRNIAGVCTLDLSTMVSDTWQYIQRPLERCPDRNAKVTLKIRSKFLREVEDSISESGKSEDLYPKSVFNRQESLRNIGQMRTYGKVTSPSHFKIDISRMNRQKSSKSFKIDSNDQKSSQAYKTTEKTNRLEETDKSRVINELKNNMNEKDRKITRLEIEKQSFSKEVETLRQQLDSFKNQNASRATKQIELTSENERLRRKLESTESSLEIMKLKKIEWEKKDNERRQTAGVQRNLLEDLQLKSDTIIQLQKQLKIMKKYKDEHEKLARDKTRELREAIEKADDFAANISTLQKRLEMKQNFYKEEIKKYNDKLIELDSEKQKIYSQLTALRESYEDKERKTSQTCRQYERNAIEERTKLTKKYEQLRAEMETMTTQNDGLHRELRISQESVLRLQKNIETLQEEREQSRFEIEKFKKQLSSEAAFRVRFEEQTKEKLALKQQKMLLQKQLQQINNQKTLIRQESSKHIIDKTQALRLANEKINELNKKLKQKDQKILESQNIQDNLNKKYQIIKKSEERKTQQITELKNIEKSLSLQLKNIEKELQQKQLGIQNSKFKYEHDIEQFKKTVKRSTEEIESLRGKLRSETQNSSKIAQSLKIMNEKYNIGISTLNKTEEKNKKLQLELLDSTFREKDLKQACDRLTVTIEDLHENLKKQTKKNEQNQNQISKLESENVKIQYLTEQLQSTEKLLKQREKQLNLRIDSNTSLELNVQKHQTTLFTLKQDLKSKVNELNKQRQLTDSLRKQLSQLTENNQQFLRQLQQKQQENNELKRNLNKLANDRSAIEERSRQAENDLRKYRTVIIDSLKSYIINIFNTRDGMILIENSEFEINEIQRQVQRRYRKMIQEQIAEVENVRLQLKKQYDDQIEVRMKREAENQEKSRKELEQKRQQFHYFRETMLIKNDQMSKQLESVSLELTSAIQEIQRLECEREQQNSKIHKQLLEIQQLKTINQQHVRQHAFLSEQNQHLSSELQRNRKQQEQIFAKIYAEREETHGMMQASEKAMMLQIEQLQSNIKEKQHRISMYEMKEKALVKEIEAKNESVREAESKASLLQSANHQSSNFINNQMKREKELLDKVRAFEQAVQLEQEKLNQMRLNMNVIPKKERQIEELKAALEREKDAANKRLSNMEQQYKNTQNNVVKAKKEAEAIQQELAKAFGEIRRLTDSKRGFQDAFSRKSLQVDEKNAEVALLKQKITRLEREILTRDDKLTESSSVSEREKQILNQQKEDALFRLRQLEMEHARLVESKSAFVKQFEKQFLKSKNQRDILLKKLTEAENGFHNANIIINNLKEQESYLMTDLDNMHKHIQALEKSNGQSRQAIETRQRNINETAIQIQKLEHECRNLQSLSREQSKRLEDAYEQIKKISEEKGNLQQTINRLNNSMAELTSLQGKYNELEHHYKDLEDHCSILESSLNKMKQDKQFVYSQLKDQVERGNRLRRDMEDAVKGHDMKVNGLTQMSQEMINERKKLVLSLQQSNDKVRRMAIDREEMVKRHQEVQRESNTKIQALQQQINNINRKTQQIHQDFQINKNALIQERSQIQRFYDQEIRAIEAKNQQRIGQFEEKFRRMQKQKFEDQASLKFQNERLKQQLKQYAIRARSNNEMVVQSQNLRDYKTEISEVRQREFMTQEPLRWIQSTIPHLIWLSQQYERIILQLNQRNQNNSGRHLPPITIMKNLHGDSELVEKLKQLEGNCVLALGRVQEMGQDIQISTEEKLKIISKARELKYLFKEYETNPQIALDKLNEILVYSKATPVQMSPRQIGSPVPVQKIEIGRRTVIQSWSPANQSIIDNRRLQN